MPSSGERPDDLSLRHELQKLREAPDDPQLNKTVGSHLYALGRYREAVPYLRKAVAATDDADAWFALGCAASGSGALPVASQALERAIALGREDPAAHAALASVLQDLGEFSAAVDHARRALQDCQDPQLRCRLHGTLAFCYSQRGDLEAALVNFQSAFELDPDDIAINHNLGVLYFQRGNYHRAMIHLDRTATLCPARADVWRDLGRAAHHAGAAERAEAAFRTAITLRDDAATRLELGEVLVKLGRAEEAIREIKRVARSQVSTRWWCRAHVLLGDAYGQLSRFDKALQSYERAVALGPDDRRARYAVGFVLNRTGNHEVAKRTLEAALRLGKDDADTHAELAYALQQLRDYGPAIMHGTRALDLSADPVQRTNVHQNLALCHQALGEQDAAFNHYQAAVRCQPDDAVANFNAGVAYVDRGEFADALPLLRKAVELRPEDTEFRRVLAQSLMTLDRPEEAEPLLRHSLESGNDDTAAMLLVQLLCERDRVAEALELAQEQASTRPDSAVIQAALSLALKVAGDEPAAARAQERAVALDPEDPWVKWAAGATLEEDLPLEQAGS